MRKWKSAVSAFLAGIMILSMAVTAFAANVTFTDTSSHWAKDQIQYLVSKDVLNGYKQSNGTYTFQPDGTVTRATNRRVQEVRLTPRKVQDENEK